MIMMTAIISYDLPGNDAYNEDLQLVDSSDTIEKTGQLTIIYTRQK